MLVEKKYPAATASYDRKIMTVCGHNGITWWLTLPKPARVKDGVRWYGQLSATREIAFIKRQSTRRLYRHFFNCALFKNDFSTNGSFCIDSRFKESTVYKLYISGPYFSLHYCRFNYRCRSYSRWNSRNIDLLNFYNYYKVVNVVSYNIVVAKKSFVIDRVIQHCINAIVFHGCPVPSSQKFSKYNASFLFKFCMWVQCDMPQQTHARYFFLRLIISKQSCCLFKKHSVVIKLGNFQLSFNPMSLSDGFLNLLSNLANLIICGVSLTCIDQPAPSNSTKCRNRPSKSHYRPCDRNTLTERLRKTSIEYPDQHNRSNNNCDDDASQRQRVPFFLSDIRIIPAVYRPRLNRRFFHIGESKFIPISCKHLVPQINYSASRATNHCCGIQ